MIRADDGYTECNDQMVNIVQDNVTNVLHRLSGQPDEHSKQQNSEGSSPELIRSGISDAFSSTMKETLIFSQEEGYSEDLVCQVTDIDTQHKAIIGATAEDTVHKGHTTTQCHKNHTGQQTKGAAFSKRFIKHIIRKISTSDNGWKTAEDPRRCSVETIRDVKTTTRHSVDKTKLVAHKNATEAEIRRMFDKEMARCGDTTADTKDIAEEWVQELSRTVQQFGLPKHTRRSIQFR